MDFYAKTIKKDKKVEPGLSVRDHCVITGWIAERLISFLPEHIRNEYKHTAFYAGLHDIGKISPKFQKHLYNKLNKDCPELQDVPDDYSRESESFHACVSAAEVSRRDFPCLHTILAMHHGFSPKRSKLACGYKLHDERLALKEEIQQAFPGEFEAMDWDLATAIGGIIIISDWLASGEPFASIPYGHQYSDDSLKEMAYEVIEKSGLAPRKIDSVSFEKVFGFKMNSIQQALIDSVTGPGVYVLEAEMGGGKTEAALGAALKMITEGKATGLYFALPTQLTSNKCCERVADFCKNSGLPQPQLLHGSSWLFKNESAPVTWCSSNAAILSQVGVGTVDQLIMALINVRHSFVRDYGLLGKVIVIDEVHSYDAYCSKILSLLIQRAKRLGCTVIILSATLTAAQKKSLLGVDVQKDAYPMVTAVVGEDVKEIPVEFKGINKTVTVLKDSTESALAKAIEASRQGQQVLWIENTVAEAQEIYSRFDGNKYLLHSAFTMEDRKEKEELCTGFMGKNGDRSVGRILVGTQVLEQSLDIDADLLITRMCPMDMLFQRIGRLWRHKRERGKGCECKTIVLPANEKMNDDFVFKGTSYVYQPYLIHRSEEVLSAEVLSLPADIRGRLEATYTDRDEEGKLFEEKVKLIKERERLEHEAKVASMKPGPEQPMDAETRLSTRPSYQVLVVTEADGNKIKTYDGVTYVIPESSAEKAEKKEFLRKVTPKLIKKQFYKTPTVTYLADYDIYLLRLNVNCDYDKQKGLVVNHDATL